jgi:hypothetical protein
MVIKRSFISILELASHISLFIISLLCCISLVLPFIVGSLGSVLSFAPLIATQTYLLQAPFLDMRNHRRSYRHLRSLIAVLDTVFPAATQDPNFLHRSLLIEGVSLRATPCDLLDEALGLQVEGAVVVRDAEFGDSVGLLVLTHAHDTEVAMAAGPRPGVFCDCIKVRTRT